MTEADSPDTQATLSKEYLACPGRDGRKAAHDHGRNERQSNYPKPAGPRKPVGRFLEECPPDTPADELGQRYREWREVTDR